MQWNLGASGCFVRNRATRFGAGVLFVKIGCFKSEEHNLPSTPDMSLGNAGLKKRVKITGDAFISLIYKAKLLRT